ncbi:MAG: hypothetical protein FD139_160 [Methylocystaceae bacterium]|nr:MAG: hypothetical protein FD172_1020 [Methylocystaceae bacterium]TXT48238.1 MAG: hypothetical protein FD139_160 [Methylocystaceae bacterium]
MPIKRSLQRRQISDLELIKLAHTDARAKLALDSFYELSKRGKRPEIWFSELNGYDVFDSVERASLLARGHKSWHGWTNSHL